MRLNISVIIPAFNAEKTLQKAINSVLSQTYPAHEIIVVNDGSNDATEKIVSLNNHPVRYFSIKNNSGASAARNLGIEKSTGNWVAFLDADDKWFPEKLSLQVQLIINNPTLKWCIGNYLLKSSNVEEVKIGKKPAKGLCETKNSSLFSDGYIFRNYFEAARKGYCYAHTNLVMVKKEALKETGLFDESLIRHQDWDLWWRIALRFPEVGYIHQPIAARELLDDDQVLMKRRVNAKRGHYLRIVYNKSINEARQIDGKNKAGDQIILNSFLRFASKNLFKAIIMQVFLGHTDMAKKTLSQFIVIFSPVNKTILYSIVLIPFMPFFLRLGYFIAQKSGLISKTKIYWEYLHFAKKQRL